ILLSAMQGQKAFVIEAPNVSRLQPAVDKTCAIKLGSIQISGHQGWTPHQDLTFRPRRDLAAVLVDDHDCTRRWYAAATGLGCTRWREVGRYLRGFTRAIVLDYGNAER